MTVKQSHLSLEYIKYPVVAKVQGVAVNPTTDTVQFAFPVRGAQPVTWLVGSWETDSNGVHYARMLIGPAATFVPSAGVNYDVWIKITDSPEVPARHIDLLVCT